MQKCVGCFKPANNPSACLGCKYVEADDALSTAEYLLNIDLPPDLAEEVKYELFCSLKGIEGVEAENMRGSGLAAIVSACADTAIYLPKKRSADLDDMKVLLFNPEFGEAYVTNGDVVIRISEIPPEVLDGMREDLPAYDYVGEKFIPNPLPYSAEDMAKVFANEYVFTVTVPVTLLLERIYQRYPEALQRRNVFMVMDVGYGYVPGSVIIPSFEIAANGTRFYIPPTAVKPFIPSKTSVIDNEFLEEGIPYVGMPEGEEYDCVRVNVYKSFESTVTMGMYKLLDENFNDDIHPFALSAYSEPDLIKFQLLSTCDDFKEPIERMHAYQNFQPLALELEYVFETLLLFRSFDYEFVNFFVKTSDEPILIEGVRTVEGQPLIEATMATVAVGEPGVHCEQVLEEELPF